ncbi:hypothetical protein GJ496_003012 [Pomphorhynchus laevis]|nr:hypothetical protein GJ496_003012 [Pomphorhynchus laevis]
MPDYITLTVQVCLIALNIVYFSIWYVCLVLACFVNFVSSRNTTKSVSVQFDKEIIILSVSLIVFHLFAIHCIYLLRCSCSVYCFIRRCTLLLLIICLVTSITILLTLRTEIEQKRLINTFNRVWHFQFYDKRYRSFVHSLAILLYCCPYYSIGLKAIPNLQYVKPCKTDYNRYGCINHTSYLIETHWPSMIYFMVSDSILFFVVIWIVIIYWLALRAIQARRRYRNILDSSNCYQSTLS